MTTELLPDVRIVNGTPRVSSRSVAERFKKLHKNVMRDVRNLIDQKPALGMLNFEHTPYVDPQNGQTYDSYEMDRKGFTLLTMSFTGAEALEWKLQYIDAFDAMETVLRSVGIPDNISAEIAAIRADVQQLAAMSLQAVVQVPKGATLVRQHARRTSVEREKGVQLVAAIDRFLSALPPDAPPLIELPGIKRRIKGYVVDIEDHNLRFGDKVMLRSEAGGYFVQKITPGGTITNVAAGIVMVCIATPSRTTYVPCKLIGKVIEDKEAA